MKGFFDSVGIHVDVWDMALWGIPTAIAALLISAIRFRQLDRRIHKNDGAQTNITFKDGGKLNEKHLDARYNLLLTRYYCRFYRDSNCTRPQPS